MPVFKRMKITHKIRLFIVIKIESIIQFCATVSFLQHMLQKRDCACIPVLFYGLSGGRSFPKIPPCLIYRTGAPDVVPAGHSTGPADPAVLKFPCSIDLADLAVRNRVFAAESFKVSRVSDQHYFLESTG